jgi:hypothetical protein
LTGADPQQAMDAALAAFTAGDLAGAVRAADGAAATWAHAGDVGRERLALAAGILTVFAALVMLVTVGRDRRSRALWSYRAGQVIRTAGSIRSVGSAGSVRPGGSAGAGGSVGPGRRRGVAPRSGAATPSPGVQVSTRHASHVSAALTPMAHAIEDGPRTWAARRGGYGTLAADLPADRSTATPTGRAASDGRPAAGPRPGDVPRDPAPGDE